MTTISEEQFWTTTLQNAGLPVKRAYKETFDSGEFEIQAEFITGLTDVQNNLFLGLTNKSKLIRKLSKSKAETTLASGGLVGRNISTINSNSDRDCLLRAICYLLEISDENGVILGEILQSPLNSNSKK